MSVVVAADADAARPVVPVSPAPDAAATALLPAPAAFASIQHDFVMTLAPHKRPNTLVDSPTYAAIRAILRDGDLAPSSAFSTWAHDTFRLDADAAYILHEDKRVARAEDLHMILCTAHTTCRHSGVEATYEEVREHWCFVPKDLVARFVQACPTCMLKRMMTPVQRISTRPRLPVPRVLIFPVAEDGPPADRPCDPAVPLGSSTFELLTGIALPRRAMRLAPPGSGPVHRKSVDAATIPPDPAIPLYSTPPSLLNLALSTTGPPPLPPRHPLRPTPKRLLTKPRTAPPTPIDARAADAPTPQPYDIDAAIPVLSSALTRTASEASLPLTPSADTKGSFARFSRERVAIPSGSKCEAMSHANSINTEYAMCDEGLGQDARSQGDSPALSDARTSAEEAVSPTPSSATSLC